MAQKKTLLHSQINPSRLMKAHNQKLARLIKNGSVLKIDNPLDLPRRWVNFLSNNNWCSIVGPFGDGYSGTNLYGQVYWGYYDDYRGRRNESARNIFVRLENGDIWNANFVPQRTIKPDKFSSEFSPAYSKFSNTTTGKVNLQIETTFFVPSNGDRTEIWIVKIKNLSQKNRTLDITFGVDAYIGSRKFEVYHHLVTGLYNKAELKDNTIFVSKGIQYEEGETVKSNNAGFMFVHSPQKTTTNFFADEEYFLGNSYNRFSWNTPLTLATQDYSLSKLTEKNPVRGVNLISAIEKTNIILTPANTEEDTIEFIVFCGAIIENKKEAYNIIKKYDTTEKANQSLEETKQYWASLNSKIHINTPDKKLNQRYNNWYLVQNFLRKRWGNTGSLYHDYGIDNFGWRDLWQDWLGWMYAEPEECEKFIPLALSGTRADGAVASGFTLNEKHELHFMNDPIKGVWCDHPFWPTLTIYEFLKNFKQADFSLLLSDNIPYIQDIYRERAKKRDPLWTPISKIEITNLKGTVFEHLWIQLMSMFFDVDSHTGLLNQMRAGWDDALDQVFGTNVPFSMAFVWGAKMLVDMLSHLPVKNLEIYESYAKLIGHSTDSIQSKLSVLQHLTQSVDKLNLGKKIKIEKQILILDLKQKIKQMTKLINRKAWLSDGHFYVGYYDSKGNPIDYYKSKNDYKLHLAPQVFALLSGVISEEKVDSLINSVFDKLWDKKIGGIILNTPYEQFYENIGRKTQFAPGTKEHSAKFTHMSLMFMAGLLFHDKANEAWRVWEGTAPYLIKDSILKVPNIWLPEYLISSANPQKNRWNEGQYEPLTASPSWIRKIISDWMFGISIGSDGMIHIKPVFPDIWKGKKLKLTRQILNAHYEFIIHFRTRKKKNYLLIDNQKSQNFFFKPFQTGWHKIELFI